MSNCRRLRKPVFARDPVGALRYAWLRAPPSNRANLTQILRESLTRNAPYEGGLAKRNPPIFAPMARMAGYASLTHPTHYSPTNSLTLRNSFVARSSTDSVPSATPK